jgi:hypothetical protein
MTDILEPILEVIGILMEGDPTLDSPKGRLLRGLSRAVADFENELYPELNLKVILDE